jgi:hypothetical protein
LEKEKEHVKVTEVFVRNEYFLSLFLIVVAFSGMSS